MNPRKGNSRGYVFGLFILLCSIGATPAAAETVLKTQKFMLDRKNPTTSVHFQVPGPGTVILGATGDYPLNQLGLIARGSDSNAADLRKDGPTPLRLEFTVTAQDLAKGSGWTAIPTIVGTNGMIYAISAPMGAATGILKVSFSKAPAEKTAMQPKAMPKWGAAGAGSGVFPAGTPQAAPVKAAQPTQAAAQPAEPKWPQPFELGAGERTGFGFVAGKPGPIVVNVQWTGVPLTVSLVKPGGGSIDQQGNGSVTLQYNATADDVKKGMLWGVSIRPTREAAKPSVGSGIVLIDRPIKQDIQGLAKGTVNVQHPPGDMKLAQAELKAKADRLALQAKSQPAPPKVDILAQKQAALQKQQAVRQAALLEQVRSKIPVQAYQQMSQRIALGEQPGASKGIIIVDTGSINSPPGASAMTAAPGIPLAQGRGVAIGEKSPTDVSMVKPTVPNPVIASLSSSSGQPGVPVLITGTGFSNDEPGEVHFVVNPGMEVKAQGGFWSDTQIIVTVPDVSGIQAFNGQVYVQRRGASGRPTRSNPLAFRFEPSVEYKTLVLESEGIKNKFIEGTDPPNSGVVQHNYNGYYYYTAAVFTPFFLTGERGDDEFAPHGSRLHNSQLKNGWTADSAYLSLPGTWGGKIRIDGSADAYISDFTPGTDTPYLKVHWWADVFSSVWYSPYIVIKGPKGLAYK